MNKKNIIISLASLALTSMTVLAIVGAVSYESTEKDKDNVPPTTEQQAQPPLTEQEAPAVEYVPAPIKFTSIAVDSVTQYSHTEKGHVEGQFYSIDSSIPTVAQDGDNQIISGTISRSGIGLEKGTIVLNYQLVFDRTGNYVTGSVTSSGYVTAEINLVPGVNYSNQNVNFLTTSTGRAGSGSLIYPIQSNLLMK